MLVDHIGKIAIRNKVYGIHSIRHELKFNPVLDLHFVVVNTDIVSVSVVFINVDVVSHFTNDLKIHFFEIIPVYQRIVYLLCNNRSGQKKDKSKTD
jgi:hypothetical protein